MATYSSILAWRIPLTEEPGWLESMGLQRTGHGWVTTLSLSLWHIQLSSSVQFSRSVVSNSLQPHEPQHARPPCWSPTPGIYPNSCPSSRWCHPTISSSVIAFSRLQSFPTSGSFPMSQLFASGGQSIEVSASTSVLAMNTQDWFPLGWTDWISLQSKGLSRGFSNTTVQKHQFFCAQFSLESNSHIHSHWHIKLFKMLKMSVSNSQCFWPSSWRRSQFYCSFCDISWVILLMGCEDETHISKVKGTSDDETHSFRVSEWDLALSRSLCPVMGLLGVSSRQPSGSEGRRCKQTSYILRVASVLCSLGHNISPKV